MSSKCILFVVAVVLYSCEVRAKLRDGDCEGMPVERSFALGAVLWICKMNV